MMRKFFLVCISMSLMAMPVSAMMSTVLAESLGQAVSHCAVYRLFAWLPKIKREDIIRPIQSAASQTVSGMHNARVRQGDGVNMATMIYRNFQGLLREYEREQAARNVPAS